MSQDKPDRDKPQPQGPPGTPPVGPPSQTPPAPPGKPGPATQDGETDPGVGVPVGPGKGP